MRHIKTISIAALLIGLAIATLLIGSFGFGKVLHAIVSAGFKGFAVFCLWQVLVMTFLGITWRSVTPEWRHAPWPFIWGRMARDSAGSCLPFSVVGGLVIGARTTTNHGVGWRMAAISTVVDCTTEFGAEIAFAAMGLGIVLLQVTDPRIRIGAGIGLALAAVGMAVVVRLQHGVAPLFASMGRRILKPWIAEGQIEQLGAEDELRAHYGDRRVLAWGTLLHLIGWVGKGLGNWIAFRLMGAHCSITAALAIEGLLHAAMVVAVMIPGYAGVQEAGYVAIGALFGIPADLCLGASLIRRARDIAIGIPVLLIWQLTEAARLKERKPPVTS